MNKDRYSWNIVVGGTAERFLFLFGWTTGTLAVSRSSHYCFIRCVTMYYVCEIVLIVVGIADLLWAIVVY